MYILPYHYLIGIPWRVAFALQADGWYLRQDIIWAKPNPMPESVKDRCTKAHEYVFLLSKSPKYYYDTDAVKELAAQSSAARLAQDVSRQAGSARVPGKTNGNMKAVGNGESRNRRSVWSISTKPFSGAHFAVMPEDLVEPCILAGCPLGGTVLDPFMGAGSTAWVALGGRGQQGAVNAPRRAVGFELKESYHATAEKNVKALQARLEAESRDLFTQEAAVPQPKRRHGE